VVQKIGAPRFEPHRHRRHRIHIENNSALLSKLLKLK
jgi:hypothetical protein